MVIDDGGNSKNGSNGNYDNGGDCENDGVKGDW